MRVTCEPDNNSGSVVTVITSNGDIVDIIPVPSEDGVLYCTENPHTEEGTRYSKAISNAKTLERLNLSLTQDTEPRWKCIRHLKPSKNGFFWVSDGHEVWAATITTLAQVNYTVNHDKARFYHPISEEQPAIPNAEKKIIH